MKQREKLWTPESWVVMFSGGIFGPLGGDSGDGCRLHGHKVWYLHDKIHREDGPAIEDTDGRNYCHYLQGGRS